MNVEQRAEGLGSPKTFALRGALQHEVALQALMHTDANPELTDRILERIATHGRMFGGNAGKIGLSTTFIGEAADPARDDITFSLIALGETPYIPERGRRAANVVLAAIQRPMR